MSLRSGWSAVLFESSASLLAFCLTPLSLPVSGVLITELSISLPFCSLCFIYFGAVLRGLFTVLSPSLNSELFEDKELDWSHSSVL